MDSYTKLAKDLFGDFNSPMFDEVYPEDKEEVAVSFARFVVHDLDNYADTFRITPTRNGFQNKKLHESKVGCCGCADTLIKCTSGNLYFIGYNFGH